MKRTILCAGAAALLAGGVLVNAAQNAKAGSAAKGKEVFEQCSVCHNTDTDEKKIGPSLKGLFKHDKLTSGKPVNEANVKAKINQGGNGMPSYSDLLSEDEKNDVLAYLKTL